ncbi:MAG: sortase [Herbinix sp.]|jgi:sortase A|nr:sortase [Herbinix sp.]
MLRRKQHNKRFESRTPFYPRITAVLFIIIGIIVSTTNLYHYSRGYLAGWLYTSPVSAKEEGTSTLNVDVRSEMQNMTVSGDNSLLDMTVDLETEGATKEPLVYEVRPEPGEQFGELYIPKLAATLPVFEGTDEEELELGVGHYDGSVLPGEKDNCVLAGHRDTVFRRLGEVGEGDKLIVRTTMGEFEYVVDKVRIVDKEDRTVIVPKPKATLTISTCYPFRYIGSAPQRYVLVAYLASTNQSKKKNER